MMKEKYNNVVTMQLKNGVHNLSLTSPTFPVPKNNFRNGLNPKRYNTIHILAGGLFCGRMFW